MLRTALLFVRSAVRLVYAELPGPVAVCLPKQELCELGITSLSKSQVSVMAKELDTAVGGHPCGRVWRRPGRGKRIGRC